MDTKDAFAAWLLSARKENGGYYTENTQQSYLTAFYKAQAQFPFLGDLSPKKFDSLTEIKGSDYYLDLPKNRRGELDAALTLYKEFLQDRENGWQTIAEFSQGKQFTTTSEFSLHITYDEPFSVKELAGFLQNLDTAFKEMLMEQGFSRSEAQQTDLTIVKVSEGSLWFEIASIVVPIVMPIVSFALNRFFKKHDEKMSAHSVDDNSAEVHK